MDGAHGDAVIIGASSVKQLEENLKTTKHGPLHEGECDIVFTHELARLIRRDSRRYVFNTKSVVWGEYKTMGGEGGRGEGGSEESRG